MKILACFKLIPDPDRILEEDWKHFSLSSNLAYAGLDYNCFDNSALEMALKLKEQAAVQGITVSCTAVTVARSVPGSVVSNLYAVGFEKVICIQQENTEFDPVNVAKSLRSYAKDADLVLMGKEAAMAQTGMVPYVLGELCGLPVIADVESAELENRILSAVSQQSTGKIQRKVRLPVICTVGNCSQILRMATLRNRMKFQGASAEIISGNPLPQKNLAFSTLDSSRTCRMLNPADPDTFRLIRTLFETACTGSTQKSTKKIIDRMLLFKTDKWPNFERISEIYKEKQPNLTVFQDTPTGRTMAVKLSQKEKLPCLFRVQCSEQSRSCLSATKQVFAGNLIWKEKFSFPAVITMDESESSKLGFSPILIENTSKPVWIESERFLDKDKNNLLQYRDTVVICGNGVRSKDICDKARKLANRQGAGFGMTRPGALNGWGDPLEIVGISGKILSPGCCLVIGAAGAGAFMAGIRNAKTIIAVNTDPDALIFKNADYGIQMDADTFLDRMQEFWEE